MNLLEQIPESAMVAAFLKAELRSARFSDVQKAAMKRFNISEQIIANPNLEDEQENQLRAQVLGDYRGYKHNREIFEGFPHDLTWHKAALTRDEVGNLRYVDYSYWNELTDNTHLVKDAVKNIQQGKVVFDIPNDRFLEVAEEIRQGAFDFEPMILTGKDEHSPLTILEGHLRATAFGLAGEAAPESIHVIVGLRQV